MNRSLLILPAVMLAICASAGAGQNADAARSQGGPPTLRWISGGVTVVAGGNYDYWKMGPNVVATLLSRRSPTSYRGVEVQYAHVLFDRDDYLLKNRWMHVDPATADVRGPARKLVTVTAAWTRIGAEERGKWLLGTLGIGFHVVSGASITVDGGERHGFSGLWAVGVLAGGGLGLAVGADHSVTVEGSIHQSLFPWPSTCLSLRLGWMRRR